MSQTDDRLRVLLVEDNPNDATLIERYLREADTAFLPDRTDIRHERRLEDAVEALETRSVDLLLLDLGLPASSGTETFERAEAAMADTPVIVLTGLQDEQAAVELLQRGAQDYLNKEELDRTQLVKSIRYALERQEREAKLRETNEKLEVLNRILRHDIQNDLQVLTGWLDAIRMRNDDDDQYLGNALDTVEHMQEITENTRAYMELVGGDGDISLLPVRVDDLLSVECTKAESNHPDAEFQVPDDPPAVTARANEMLSSVFRNLLNNAVQHCDENVPEVVVTMDVDEDTVCVSVADNGPGVPDEQKQALFGKGTQGADSSGTGIGLYLAQTLTTEFGGRIWVEDNEPRGAIFNVELPLAEA